MLGSEALHSGNAFGASPVSGAIPIVVTVQPTVVTPGCDVTVTVVLDQTVSADQEVKVTTDATLFTNWTNYVTVPAGSDRVSFTRTLTAGADGAFSVAATCNGGAAASLGVVIKQFR